VELGDARDQRVAAPVMGLEDRRDLLGGFDFAFPAVDRADWREDVDAGARRSSITVRPIRSASSALANTA